MAFLLRPSRDSYLVGTKPDDANYCVRLRGSNSLAVCGGVRLENTMVQPTSKTGKFVIEDYCLVHAIFELVPPLSGLV